MVISSFVQKLILILSSAMLATLISAIGLWYGRDAYNRQFGFYKVPFKLDVVGFSYPEYEKTLVKKSFLGAYHVEMNDLNDMILLNPSVILEVLSDQPLEAFRIEVTPVLGIFDTTKDIGTLDTRKTPWVLEAAVSKEYPVTFRPQKGQKISVKIADLLIRLMAQYQVKEPDRRKKIHYANSTVSLRPQLVLESWHDFT